jgi:peroxiredoxin
VCRQHLVEMQRERGAIEVRGAQLIAIAQGTTADAERYCSALGVTYRCLGDPQRDSYRAFELPRGGFKEILFDPMRAGNQAMRKGFKVSIRDSLRRHSDWFQLPGVAIVDRAGRLRYLYRSRHAGDLPAMDALLAVLDDIERAAGAGG